MFKAAFASVGEAIDNLFTDDEHGVDENVLVPAPPMNDTPRTQGREAIVERERLYREKNLRGGKIIRRASMPQLLEVEEEAEAPPTARMRLTSEQAEVSTELFSVFANNGNYFVKEDMTILSNGWESPYLKFENMDKNGDGKVDLDEWMAFSEKLCAELSWTERDGVQEHMLQMIEKAGTRIEWIAKVRAEREHAMQEVIRMKEHYETSKQAILNAPDIPGGLTKAQRAKAVEIFELIDYDGNGRLTKDEIMSQSAGHDTGMFKEIGVLCLLTSLTAVGSRRCVRGSDHSCERT